MGRDTGHTTKTKNVSLKTLSISNNKLTSLDVTQNISLERLYVADNKLTSLDLSQNNPLIHLYCGNNPSLTCIQVVDVAWYNNLFGRWTDSWARYSEDCGY